MINHMPYTTNPYLPKVRAKAVMLVKNKGWSTRKVARHFGVSHSSVVRWLQKSPSTCTIYEIPTLSSRPKTSPRATDEKIIKRILEVRLKRNRCAQIVHAQLKREGIKVSLSTVKRTLDKYGLIKKRSPWKKYHQNIKRPKIAKPGDLGQLDTIHIPKSNKNNVYIFTLIDCHSRWAQAKAMNRVNTYSSLQAFKEARKNTPFNFRCIQSDNGPEFSKYFTSMVEPIGIKHRHSRVRKPNDNAHVERFNRTIQEEMRDEIIKYKNNTPWLNRKINEYLHYYNTERLHMGINYQTPLEVVQRS